MIKGFVKSPKAFRRMMNVWYFDWSVSWKAKRDSRLIKKKPEKYPCVVLHDGDYDNCKFLEFVYPSDFSNPW